MPTVKRPIASTRENTQSSSETNAMTATETTVDQRAVENEVDVEDAQREDRVGDAERHQHHGETDDLARPRTASPERSTPHTRGTNAVPSSRKAERWRSAGAADASSWPRSGPASANATSGMPSSVSSIPRRHCVGPDDEPAIVDVQTRTSREEQPHELVDLVPPSGESPLGNRRTNGSSGTGSTSRTPTISMNAERVERRRAERATNTRTPATFRNSRWQRRRTTTT